MVKVFCHNSGESLDVQEGTTLLEIIDRFNFERPYPILAAKVNNVVEGLKFRIFNSREVQFLDYTSYAGRSVYARSLCFVLSKACSDLFPGSRLVIRRPISKGYFCRLEKIGGGNDSPSVTVSDVEAIKKHMTEVIARGAEFHRHEVQSQDAIDLFSSLGYDDKVKLLQTCGKVYTSYYTLEDTPDIYYDVMLPGVSYLDVWNLEPYHDGMLLRLPDRHNPASLAPKFDQPKTFEILQENLRWNSLMGLRTVGDVNVACLNGGATDLIQVSEALQEKKLVQIAEEIARRFHSEAPDSRVRLVLITGPSSSGKSTVCKRLAIQLKACGLHPMSVSTDDYFVDRVKTPLLPDGSYDFDNFDTVDHDAMQQDILRLLGGEKVQVPEYNFVTGIREYNGRTLELGPGSVLLVEGIHALNPALTNLVPESAKFRIFINTITSISLDDHNSIATSDNRLLRRIVRDYVKGAFSAQETISHWPNVRRDEVKWIYPYQETADVLFNSAYLVEFAVMRSLAEKVLATVPNNVPEYSEANRLMRFLSYFVPVSDKDVPSTSLLRSFLGGGNL